MGLRDPCIPPQVLTQGHEIEDMSFGSNWGQGDIQVFRLSWSRCGLLGHCLSLHLACGPKKLSPPLPEDPPSVVTRTAGAAWPSWIIALI